MRRKEILGALLVAFLLFLIFKSCDHKKIQEITNESLQPGEHSAIIFEPNTNTIKVITGRAGNGDGIWSSSLRGRKPVPPSVPGVNVQSIDGARGVRISIAPDGKTSVTSRTRGILFEPGPTIVFSDRCRLGLDVQWAFVRRWGVNTGVVGGTDKSIRLYVAGSYLLPYKHLNNTSVLAGIDSDKKLLLGIKVRF